jgi:transposase
MLAKLFFSENTGIQVDHACRDDAVIHLFAVAIRHRAKCPLCHRRSKRVHSWYERTVADLPCAGSAVTIHLATRRFVCRTPWCPRKIFTERLPAVVAPRARKTTRLWAQLQGSGFALGAIQDLATHARPVCP